MVVLYESHRFVVSGIAPCPYWTCCTAADIKLNIWSAAMRQFCTQDTVLRQNLSEAYWKLDELKFLEASIGIREAEEDIVSLHENIARHRSLCAVCCVQIMSVH